MRLRVRVRIKVRITFDPHLFGKILTCEYFVTFKFLLQIERKFQERKDTRNNFRPKIEEKLKFLLMYSSKAKNVKDEIQK